MEPRFSLLPFDILRQIANHTSLQTRISLSKAKLTGDPLVKPQSVEHAKLWSAIFKTDEWTNKVMALDYGNSANPEPCVVGKRMKMRRNKGKKRTNLILLTNDWDGCVPYEKELFYRSLQNHRADEHDKNLIHFTDSSISLHIQDAVESTEFLDLENPNKYVFTNRGKLSTYVCYWTNPNFLKLGPDDIGGLEGEEPKKAIRDLVCIKVQFREGAQIYRGFYNGASLTGLVPNRVKLDGRPCIKSWKRALVGMKVMIWTVFIVQSILTQDVPL